METLLFLTLYFISQLLEDQYRQVQTDEINFNQDLQALHLEVCFYLNLGMFNSDIYYYNVYSYRGHHIHPLMDSIS